MTICDANATCNERAFRERPLATRHACCSCRAVTRRRRARASRRGSRRRTDRGARPLASVDGGRSPPTSRAADVERAPKSRRTREFHRRNRRDVSSAASSGAARRFESRTTSLRGVPSALHQVRTLTPRAAMGGRGGARSGGGGGSVPGTRAGDDWRRVALELGALRGGAMRTRVPSSARRRTRRRFRRRLRASSASGSPAVTETRRRRRERRRRDHRRG